MPFSRLNPHSARRVGYGLRRPKCVLGTADGTVYASYLDGGVTRLRPDGTQTHIRGSGPAIATSGFSLTRQGDFLCADLLPPGGVWRLSPDGQQTPFLPALAGQALMSINCIHCDAQDRVWLMVSTRQQPRELAYRPAVADGYIVRVDSRGAQLAADGLGYANEASLSPDGDWLYVNETFARRTSRFRVAGDGTLGAREIVARYGAGIFPDGLAFDDSGGLWIASIVSNRVLRIDPDGSRTILLEEYDPLQLASVEKAFQADQLGSSQLSYCRTEVLKNVASLAFGGPDRRTLYLGNLLDEHIYAFPSPVAGAEPAHWRYA